MQGKVTVNGQVETKAGTSITPDAIIVCDTHEPPFVSRAGEKLAFALKHFNINTSRLVALDAGISTGGFTDCLLQAGITRVYGIDVGYGQVHEKIRTDQRVILMERTNLRYLATLPEKVDLVTLDLSFISVLKVIPAISKLIKDSAILIILIKPQFEAGRQDIATGGIVRDSAVHERVIQTIIAGMHELGFVCQGVTPSPILGGHGNKEFLAHFIRK